MDAFWSNSVGSPYYDSRDEMEENEIDAVCTSDYSEEPLPF